MATDCPENSIIQCLKFEFILFRYSYEERPVLKTTPDYTNCDDNSLEEKS